MECSDIQERLSLYLDHELAAEQQIQMMAHLAECQGCQEELDQMRLLFGELQDPVLQRQVLHDPSPLPPDFTDQVMQRVIAERPTGVNLIWPWLRRRWSRTQFASLAYAMSATAVVVSASEFVYVWNQTTNRLGIWIDQILVYWDAAAAYVNGIGAYLATLLQALLTLFQLG